jgi:hypothetical protein
MKKKIQSAKYLLEKEFDSKEFSALSMADSALRVDFVARIRQLLQIGSPIFIILLKYKSALDTLSSPTKEIFLQVSRRRLQPQHLFRLLYAIDIFNDQ